MNDKFMYNTLSQVLDFAQIFCRNSKSVMLTVFMAAWAENFV